MILLILAIADPAPTANGFARSDNQGLKGYFAKTSKIQIISKLTYMSVRGYLLVL
jgi:hypothetical protein